MRLMSTRIDGRSRRKLSIGTRLCPPAMIFASPPPPQRGHRHLDAVGDDVSNAAGFMRFIAILVLPAAQANSTHSLKVETGFREYHAQVQIIRRRPLSPQPREQVVLQRDGARAALDQAINDAGEELELLAG